MQDKITLAPATQRVKCLYGGSCPASPTASGGINMWLYTRILPVSTDSYAMQEARSLHPWSARNHRHRHHQRRMWSRYHYCIKRLMCINCSRSAAELTPAFALRFPFAACEHPALERCVFIEQTPDPEPESHSPQPEPQPEPEPEAHSPQSEPQPGPEPYRIPTTSACSTICPGCDTNPPAKCSCPEGACWPGKNITHSPDHTCDCFAKLGFCKSGQEPKYTPGVVCPDW